MDITKIISVAGMSGLFKVVAQIKNGYLVESLVDNKRFPVYASHKATGLLDVSIYSTGEDVPLKDVLQMIYDKESGAACIDSKKPDAELKAYFKSVFPEYDQDRVYLSDIKKVYNWYNVLQKAGLLEKQEEEHSEEEKLKLNANESGVAANKVTLKDTNSKPIKTASSKVKTQGVRKTGVA